MKPPQLPVTHRLTGREDHVVNVLNAAHARGHLLDYHSPQRLDNGRVAVTITLLQPATTPAPRSGLVRRGLLLALKVLGGFAGVGVLAAIGWGVWLLLVWIHAHPWLPFVGFVVASVLVGAGSASTAIAYHDADGPGWRHR